MTKPVRRLLNALLIFALVAFALAGLTAVPIIDDVYSIGVTQHLGVFGAFQQQYYGWQGRYSYTVFLFGILPLAPNLITALFPSVLIFASVVVFYRLLKSRVDDALMLALGLVLSALLIMPNLYQTVYWFSGSVDYFMPLLMFGVLLCYLDRPQPLTMGAFALAFIATGFAEVTAPLMGLILLYLYWRKREKTTLAALIGVISGFIIIALAPGNVVRAAALGVHWALPDVLSVAAQQFAYFLAASLPSALVAWLIGFALPIRWQVRRLRAVLVVTLGALAIAFYELFAILYLSGTLAPRHFILPAFVLAGACMVVGSLCRKPYAKTAIDEAYMRQVKAQEMIYNANVAQIQKDFEREMREAIQ